MTENKQKKIQRISKDQKEKLVDYMATHLEFARGQFGGPNSNIKNKDDWETLSTILNAMGGSSKTTDQWKKCWIDLKAAVKKQLNAKRHFLNKTGGGSSTDAPRDLNSFEEQILSIMGVDAVDGDAVTPESGVPATGKELLSIEFLNDISDVLPPAKRQKKEPDMEGKRESSSSYKSALVEAKEMHEKLEARIEALEVQSGQIIKKLDLLISAFGLEVNN